MEKKNRLISAASSALVVMLMAGCAAYAGVCALGFSPAWPGVYLIALAAALVVGLAGRSTPAAIAGAGVLVIGFGALLASRFGEIAGLLGAVFSRAAEDAQALSTYAAGAGALALLAALLLGTLFAALMKKPAGAPFAILIAVAAVVCALALNEELPVSMAVPGLAGATAAFGMSSELRRGVFRPLILAPALLAALLALLLSPSGRVTWAPLENLANSVRSVVEDYVHFTEQRVAFTINEAGYDHAGMIGDTVEAMLGGPASPSEGAVMRVETTDDLLLRGTIKRSYTGYSWVDDQAKARYLYYDFTHRGTRSSVFDMDKLDSGAFKNVSATVEMLTSGTSTLFIPAQLTDFSMSLSDAVYYNSTGELFLTREVAPGDSYSFEAQVPLSDAALIQAAASAELAQDSRYDGMLAAYTQVPDGIDSQVYALAVQLTQDTGNYAEKALSIESYLAQNYGYTLEAGYPDTGRDFVSYFLLEAREGYCSYFASAMTVMCRVAGLPARYVEGYAVYAGADGVSYVTGKNAHAWTEVYLSGLGWIAFDPTARTSGYSETTPPDEGDGGDANTPDEGGSEGEETPFTDDSAANDAADPGDTSPSPSPSPDTAGSIDEPTPTPDSGDSAPDSPTPTPDSGMDDADTPTQPPENPFAEDQNPPDAPQDNPDSGHAWLWILALLLAALAITAAVFLIRRRLAATDALKLAAAAPDAQTAALILYRACLTLLAQLGIAPSSGETPEQFAARAGQTLPNPEYSDFVRAVAASRYSGRPLDKKRLQQGARAYSIYLNGLKPAERLRFALHRVTRGLGSFEMIP